MFDGSGPARCVGGCAARLAINLGRAGQRCPAARFVSADLEPPDDERPGAVCVDFVASASLECIVCHDCIAERVHRQQFRRDPVDRIHRHHDGNLGQLHLGNQLKLASYDLASNHLASHHLASHHLGHHDQRRTGPRPAQDGDERR
ncbi:MAG: hypothetical protein M3Z00_02655 [Actinomycetota bacterium]|nr:hypothetical protein [Actinomycetota bacterium]